MRDELPRGFPYDVRPKHHWAWHLFERCAYLHPRIGNCLLDEDYVGKMKLVVKASTHNNQLHRIPRRVRRPLARRRVRVYVYFAAYKAAMLLLPLILTYHTLHTNCPATLLPDSQTLRFSGSSDSQSVCNCPIVFVGQGFPVPDCSKLYFKAFMRTIPYHTIPYHTYHMGICCRSHKMLL